MKTSKILLTGLGLMALGALTSTANAGGISFSISIGHPRPAVIYRPPVFIPPPPVFCPPPVPIIYPPPVHCAPVFVAPAPRYGWGYRGPRHGYGHGRGRVAHHRPVFHGRGGRH